MPTDAAPDRDPSSAAGEEFSRDLILRAMSGHVNDYEL
jgi:hypothetical protein